MHLQDQVTSSDLSHLLKKVGVTQDALYYWDTKGNLLPKEETYTTEHFHEWYSAAFTVAELGNLLPEWCSSSRDLDGRWQAYPSAVFDDIEAIHEQPTEAEARGKLLAALYERHPDYALASPPVGRFDQ